MKKRSVLTLAAAAVLALSACGGGNSAPAASSSTTPAISPTQSTQQGTPSVESTPEASTPAPSESTPAPTSADPSSSEAPSGGAPSTAKPAAPGAKLKSGTAASLPESVLGFSKDASGGPSVIYKDKNAHMIGVSAPLSSPLEALAEYIKKDKTRAGTGWCGNTGVAGSTSCYIDTADGVVGITSSESDVSLPDTVAFVNQLSEQVGTK